MTKELVADIGMRFGKLVVTSRAPKIEGRKKIRWNCLCDCGNTTCATTDTLRIGSVRSCGCLRREVVSKLKRKHGMSRSNAGMADKTYSCWVRIKDRCTNPNCEFWHRYGGRGITMCERWSGSFENFLADMGEAPTGMTIDRYPNNDGNYEPGNCRWATQTEQVRNRSNTVMVECFGRTQSIAAWAEEFNLEYDLVYRRIYRYGWSIEKSITTPVLKTWSRHKPKS